MSKSDSEITMNNIQQATFMNSNDYSSESSCNSNYSNNNPFECVYDKNENFELDEEPRKLPQCGPLSWKIRENILNAESESLKPNKLIRCCKTSCWTHAENILRASGRKKIKDCFADIHYRFKNRELDQVIVGAYVYIVGSIYNENFELKYARITAEINAKLAQLHYDKTYGFDICDVVIRSPLTWQKVDYID